MKCESDICSGKFFLSILFKAHGTHLHVGLNNLAMLGKLIEDLLHANNKSWVQVVAEKYLVGNSTFAGVYKPADSYHGNVTSLYSLYCERKGPSSPISGLPSVSYASSATVHGEPSEEFLDPNVVICETGYSDSFAIMTNNIDATSHWLRDDIFKLWEFWIRDWACNIVLISRDMNSIVDTMARIDAVDNSSFYLEHKSVEITILLRSLQRLENFSRSKEQDFNPSFHNFIGSGPAWENLSRIQVQEQLKSSSGIGIPY
ncbi:hypothetical protein RJT34_21847 [Clitoria ternatea]|uniref:C2H2-type domain-containing protein n=1 Tax=Clitoria ternatea TaxID=43366 RepID=A0AAN9IUN5_CLITE